jgi:hypothetical protein
MIQTQDKSELPPPSKFNDNKDVLSIYDESGRRLANGITKHERQGEAAYPDADTWVISKPGKAPEQL